MKTTSTAILALSLCLFVGCASGANSTAATESTAETVSQAEKVKALLTSIETGAQEPIAYINPKKYIQHNPGVADGLEGFAAVLQNPPAGGFKARVVRVFEDSDFAFAHTEYDFFGPKAGFDIFRFEQGKIVEHWDNLTAVAGPNPSGHTQFDGPTEATDPADTAANKTLVTAFVDSVLIGGDMSKLAGYFDGDNYIQHNPTVADGLSGFGAAMKALAQQGIEMKYTKRHMVLGQGNFVLVVSEGTFGGKPYAYYDLFRVQKNKIAEHWDVMAEIPPKDTWKNQNGKF